MGWTPGNVPVPGVGGLGPAGSDRSVGSSSCSENPDMTLATICRFEGHMSREDRTGIYSHSSVRSRSVRGWSAANHRGIV